jgi:dTDP-glucose pyrophosphorylase
MKGSAGEIVGLIPAAGVGTRLYPFARAVPKELYPILGKPAIEHCMENLREGGIRKIYVLVGYQKGALMDYLGDGSDFGVKIAYLYQHRRLGLGHAVLQAKGWIGSTFVTLLGDSFIEPKREIRDLIDLHLRERPLATLLLFRVEDPSSYGVAKFRREGELLVVEKLIEKPGPRRAREMRVDGRFYALCGAYVFEPGIFRYLEETPSQKGGEIQLTDALELAVERGERVLGLELAGRYIDVGKWETVFRTERELLSSLPVEECIREREEMARRTL